MNYQEMHDTSKLLGVNPFDAIGVVEGDIFICDDLNHEWYGKPVTFIRPMKHTVGSFKCLPESTSIQSFFLYHLKPYEPERNT